MIYLDYNATTPVDERVLNEMLPYFSQQFGNAASAHPFGFDAKKAVDIAREKIAQKLHCEAQEIIFTSGATESINLAIKGVFEMYVEKGNHIITVATEHKAVLDTCRKIEKQGAQITYLPVDKYGLVNIEALRKAIRPTTILIAVMYANNETGVIQPIKKIGEIAKENNIIFFSDATQAIGKIEMNVKEDYIDLLCFSGHKIYAPKGIGGLYISRKNPRVALAEQINGGGHQRGWRSGTLNVPSIVALGKAIDLFSKDEDIRIKNLRDKLETELLQIEGTSLNGDKIKRLVNVSNISFANINGKMLIADLTKKIAISTGSACSAASVEPSHVLEAMAVDEQLSKNSIRFSLGRWTTEQEINFTIDFVKETITNLKITTHFK
ncbi:cysteine desulfurase family protein [Arachidicoccus sp.]|uniref:cysteine desulfurase family protein n=1 Tax=Arachidicoccus sp. TaxID=1872624 RepID=UPI003D194055